jgi:hypothetical protein
MTEPTVVDQLLTRIRNHKIAAGAIVVGTAVIAIAAVVKASQDVKDAFTSQPRIEGVLVAESVSASPIRQLTQKTGRSAKEPRAINPSTGASTMRGLTKIKPKSDDSSFKQGLVDSAVVRAIQYVITVLNPGDRPVLVNYARVTEYGIDSVAMAAVSACSGGPVFFLADEISIRRRGDTTVLRGRMRSSAADRTVIASLRSGGCIGNAVTLIDGFDSSFQLRSRCLHPSTRNCLSASLKFSESRGIRSRRDVEPMPARLHASPQTS